MPGMPIFQDSPGQLKSQIYVWDNVSSEIAPLQVDDAGQIAVTGEVDVDAITGDVSVVNGTTDFDIGTVDTVTTLGSITGDVGVVNGASDLDIGTVDTVTTITNDVGVVNGASDLDIGTVDTVTTLGSITGDVGVVNGASDLDIGTVDTVTTLGSITGDVGVVNGASDLDIGTVDTVTTLGSITGDVGVVNGASDLDIGTVDTVTTITNDVGVINGASAFSVQNNIVFTDEDSFGGATPLTSKSVGIAEIINSDSMDISQETSYGWFLKNTGTIPITQTVTIVVQISPDDSNWLNDTGTVISVAAGASASITVTHFMHYARFVLTGGSAATTVISCFQAQH